MYLLKTYQIQRIQKFIKPDTCLTIISIKVFVKQTRENTIKTEINTNVNN